MSSYSFVFYERWCSTPHDSFAGCDTFFRSFRLVLKTRYTFQPCDSLLRSGTLLLSGSFADYDALGYLDSFALESSLRCIDSFIRCGTPLHLDLVLYSRYALYSRLVQAIWDSPELRLVPIDQYSRGFRLTRQPPVPSHQSDRSCPSVHYLTRLTHLTREISCENRFVLLGRHPRSSRLVRVQRYVRPKRLVPKPRYNSVCSTHSAHTILIPFFGFVRLQRDSSHFRLTHYARYALS